MRHRVSDCPIDGAMRLLSGRWPGLILYYLKDRPRRFTQLLKDNPGLSRRMLALELEKLERAQVISRLEHPGYPRRVDYELTDSGRALAALVDALGDWFEAATPPLPDEPEAGRAA